MLVPSAPKPYYTESGEIEAEGAGPDQSRLRAAKMQVLKVVLAFAVVALASAEEAAATTATEATAEVEGAGGRRRQSLRVQIAARATADCSADTTGCVECCGPTNECCVPGTSCQQNAEWGPRANSLSPGASSRRFPFLTCPVFRALCGSSMFCYFSKQGMIYWHPSLVRLYTVPLFDDVYRSIKE